MAVIAILISMAIPSFRGMQQEARKTKASGDLRVLKMAIESYYKNNGWVYPPTGTTWETLLTTTAVVPNIINTVIYDQFNPTANTQYGYNLSGGTNGQYYVIYSVGPLCSSNPEATTAAVSVTGAVTLSVPSVVWDSNGHSP
jgi:type II secretory pathway pseudopilin PulG